MNPYALPDDAPLLIDDLYRACFDKKQQQRFSPFTRHKTMRRVLQQARRFVLDAPMSSFLADISSAIYDKRHRTITAQSVHHARRSARLPHDVTWIEFEVPAYDAREIELCGERLNFEPPANQYHLREGWLLNGFDESRNEFRLHLFRQFINDDTRERCSYGVPFPVYWRTDEGAVSCFATREDSVQRALTDAAIGVAFLSLSKHLKEVGVSLHSELLNHHPDFKALIAKQKINIQELGVWIGVLTGVMRRVWPLLATINDIPMIKKPGTRVVNGFRARAQYQNFLTHKIITLHVPQESEKRIKLARSIVAASKRRAHQVRGHWRHDWVHPLSALCDHYWERTEGLHRICGHCGGHDIFIVEHQRGDASLGFVTHDYNVKHETAE